MSDRLDKLKPSFYGSSSIAVLAHENAKKMSPKDFKTWMDSNPSIIKGEAKDYANSLLNAIKADVKDTRISGKVEKAGSEYSDIFKGYLTKEKTEKKYATDFMEKLGNLKHREKKHKFEASHDLVIDFIKNPENYEKFGITNQEDLEKAIETGWDAAKVPKGTIDVDSDAVMKAGILPDISIEDLRTGWENLTRAGDKNLADFDITSTMGVETPETPAGLSTDVFTPPAYETFAPREGITTLGTDYEEDLANQMAFAANPTFETSEEREEYNRYLSDIAGIPKIKQGWNFPSLENIRNVGSLAWAGAKKQFPIGLAMSAFKPDEAATFRAHQGKDPNLGRGLSGKVSFAGIAYDKEHGSGAYGQKNIDDWVTKYKDVDYQTQKMKDKYTNMYSQSTQGKQAAVAAAQAAQVAQAYQHQTGAGSGYAGGEHAADPSGATYTDPFDPGGGEAEGGLIRKKYFKGGIVDLWRELSNL